MSPLDELRALGLTIAIDDVTATRILIDLERIDARVEKRESEYWRTPRRPVSDAYTAIAKRLVGPDTPDQVLDQEIPGVILAFHSMRPSWVRYQSLGQLMLDLNPCVKEWKANRLEMSLGAKPSQSETNKGANARGIPQAVEQSTRTAEEEAAKPAKPVRRLDTERIQRWIEDNGYTNAELAEALSTSPKTVSSLRNNGDYHGTDAVTKLANLMRCEFPSDLYLD